jgi:hypothetical protein
MSAPTTPRRHGSGSATPLYECRNCGMAPQEDTEERTESGTANITTDWLDL